MFGFFFDRFDGGAVLPVVVLLALAWTTAEKLRREN